MQIFWKLYKKAKSLLDPQPFASNIAHPTGLVSHFLHCHSVSLQASHILNSQLRDAVLSPVFVLQDSISPF